MATPWCTGQLEPSVKGLSHQSSRTMGSVSDFETFQARTVRKTHSGKNGQYNSGIFNQPPESLVTRIENEYETDLDVVRS